MKTKKQQPNKPQINLQIEQTNQLENQQTNQLEIKQTNQSEVKNKILQKYLALSTNYAICIDITLLGLYGELFLALDLAGRTIVGHCYNSQNITTSQVCETIQTIVRQRSFLPQIAIIHSDRGSIFTNQQFYQCLEQLNIDRSRGSAKAYQNQAIERLNASIKNILRSIINPKWKKKQPDPFSNLQFSFEEMDSFIKQAIEVYNQRPHKALHGLSPNQMEEALYLKHGNQHPTNFTELVIAKDNSPLAIAAEQYKQKVALEYKGDWERFFLDWRTQQETFQQQLIQELRQDKEKAEQTLEELTKQYDNIYTQNLELTRKLEEVYQESLQLKKEREEKQFKKQRKKEAQKLPLRDTIDLADFERIILLVRGRAGAKERRRLAFVLLYLTGLRVSNLLLFSVAHARELFEKGNTRIQLIKGGEKRFPIRLSPKGRNLLLRFKEDFIKLTRNKSADAPLFTTAKDFTKPIARDNFDKELNKILAIASAQLEKHLRTHSFRATIITELLKSSPIDDVKELIGHKSISSTLEYKRSRLHPRQMDKMLSALNPLWKSKRGRPRSKKHQTPTEITSELTINEPLSLR